MREKKAVTKEVAKRYQKASKYEKGIILSELTSLTGYHRTYASWLLSNHGRKIRISHKLVIETEVNRNKKPERQRERIYGDKVLRALTKIWLIMGCICGKRLAPMLKEIIPRLKEHNEVLKAQYTKLNPAELQRQIIRLQEKLQELVLLKEEIREKTKPVCHKKDNSCYAYV